MTLNDAIRDIQENEALQSETRNILHAATFGHPWCSGKSFNQRKKEVLWAIAGRGIHGLRIMAVERSIS